MGETEDDAAAAELDALPAASVAVALVEAIVPVVPADVLSSPLIEVVAHASEMSSVAVAYSLYCGHSLKALLISSSWAE